MKKKKRIYICSNCGYHSFQWFGQCPSCNAWDSFVEKSQEKIEEKGKAVYFPLSSIGRERVNLIKTGIGEFDNVLGGGIVGGSVILIGGPPGTGKSTLLLQIGYALAKEGKKVVYSSGEESAEQIHMRAERINAISENIIIYSGTNFNEVEEIVEKIKPSLLVVDSVQTFKLPHIPASPGSPIQVREVTEKVVEVSKKNGIPSLLVGHVTKEGFIAGPKILEHMVDVVLYFEFQESDTLRVLRAVKNRFGNINEVGLFNMTPEGMVEIKETEKLFVSGNEMSAGKALTSVREGTRDFTVEIQSLVRHTPFGYGRRVITGIDTNRVLQIIAVIESAGGPDMRNSDVYLSTVRGIRIQDTSADLGVTASLLSSITGKPLPQGSLYMGEVTLTGEVIGTFLLKERIRSMERRGFKKLYVPSSCVVELAGIEVEGVKDIKTFLKQFL